jgi:chromosomal replication initiator protein
VQFLSGREKTQHEFFNIFNALYQKDKQIVISSDRPPKSISTLEDRLRSRFEGGMIADINKPNFEVRLAILQSKALEKKITFPEETLRYIAENITHNIRELEGALNRVLAFSQLQNISPSPELAEKALADLIGSGKKKTVTQKDVIMAICNHYDISPEDLERKGRKKEITHSRHIAMFLLRSELKLSFKGIGRCFGGRDHTTAMHAYEKISSELEKNVTLKEEVSAVREKIYVFE